jgi:hypothetical protein
MGWMALSMSETYALKYWWCSPPRWPMRMRSISAAAIIPTERTATMPQPGAREQSSCCGVRADAVSITSAAPPSMSLVLSCFAQFHV